MRTIHFTLGGLLFNFHLLNFATARPLGGGWDGLAGPCLTSHTEPTSIHACLASLMMEVGASSRQRRSFLFAAGIAHGLQELRLGGFHQTPSLRTQSSIFGPLAG